MACSIPKLASEERNALVEKHRSFWGDRWFVLPNVVYGDWESALFDYDHEISDHEELRRKLALMKD